ncbi:RING finger protein 212B-like [Megalops cyprinoides]|uniref:RING finger protein 212B-like n=1 Tax=Megalops cyprinoides TaxID=118141 RepID=UPI00186538B9|nr:RING finger protein 212B-like [Megalops cyprinoides]
MDWLHCNCCFRQEGRSFAVSSCGHITCEGCINPKQCNICGSSCNYLPISDKMKPREQVYFKDPVKLLQSRLEHISQIALFQRRQKERVTAFFKHKSLELERRLKEVMEQSYRELSALKRENAELKKPLSQRRVSPGQFQTSSYAPPSRLHRQTPGSVASLSSLSSLRDHAPRTPTNPMGTPHRPGPVTPNFFQFQFGPGTLQSPMTRSQFSVRGLHRPANP